MPAWLPLEEVEAWLPLARRWGVSEVARGPGGFLPAYRRAGGDPRRMSEYWRNRRDGFVARHMAQMRNEPLFRDGMPTRRHLALIMWAYSPRPRSLVLANPDDR